MDAQKVNRCFVLWGTVFSLANNFVSLFNSQSSNKTKINLQRPRPFVQSFIDMHALRQRHTQIPNTCLCRLYECGRVFPAGVGPGSPSRDSVNWLSMRFSRSVETRRQYGWLRIVFPGARLFRVPIWYPSGGGDTRETGSTVVESPVVPSRVGADQIRRERRAARLSTSQGSAEPLCARIKGANREVSEGTADL